MSATFMEGEVFMEKVDFKKSLKNLYAPSAKQFSRVHIPPLRYLMIDGAGDPNASQAYTDVIEALYGVAYSIKFASKTQVGRDYVVPPLEGLWWADDVSSFVQERKDEWYWAMMIMQPEWITPAMITEAVETVRRKKKLPALDLLRQEILDEGDSVQIMHVGPYEAEGPVLARLYNDYLPEHGLVPAGRHHEIYISDPRKVAAHQLKTVLRQPVKPR